MKSESLDLTSQKHNTAYNVSIAGMLDKREGSHSNLVGPGRWIVGVTYLRSLATDNVETLLKNEPFSPLSSPSYFTLLWRKIFRKPDQKLFHMSAPGIKNILSPNQGAKSHKNPFSR